MWGEAGRIRVCVRKRPLLPHEQDAAEFDVLTCCGRSAVLHQTRRRVDRERVLENHTFGFDELFEFVRGFRHSLDHRSKLAAPIRIEPREHLCFFAGHQSIDEFHRALQEQQEAPPPRRRRGGG